MDFALTDEQQLFRRTPRDFVDKREVSRELTEAECQQYLRRACDG